MGRFAQFLFLFNSGRRVFQLMGVYKYFLQKNSLQKGFFPPKKTEKEIMRNL